MRAALAALLAILLALSGCAAQKGREGKTGLSLALSESPADAELVAYFDAKKLLASKGFAKRSGLDETSVKLALLLARGANVAVLGDGGRAYTVFVWGGDVALAGSMLVPGFLKRISPDTEMNFSTSEHFGQRLSSNGKVAYFARGGALYAGEGGAVKSVAGVLSGQESAEGKFGDIARNLPADADFSAVMGLGNGSGYSRLALAGYVEGEFADTYAVLEADDADWAMLSALALSDSDEGMRGKGVELKSARVDGRLVFLQLEVDIGKFDPSMLELLKNPMLAIGSAQEGNESSLPGIESEELLIGEANGTGGG